MTTDDTYPKTDTWALAYDTYLKTLDTILDDHHQVMGLDYKPWSRDEFDDVVGTMEPTTLTLADLIDLAHETILAQTAQPND